MNAYIVGRSLHESANGATYKVLHRPTGKFYAMRVFDKERMSFDDEIDLRTEIDVLLPLNHPGLLNVHEYFEQDDTVYVMYDLVEGGDLFDRLIQKASYSEKEARDLIKMLLEAIGYCHENNVMHRNLKPENIMLLSIFDSTYIKLTNFIFAASTNHEQTSICGAPDYIAPEILANMTMHSPYNAAVDIWSIGVIAYVLLCGCLPFFGDTQEELFASIQRGIYDFDPPDWAAVSNNAKNFVIQALALDPKHRPGARELLQHPWITDTSITSMPLLGTQGQLRKLSLARKFKAAVHTVKILRSAIVVMVKATVALKKAFCTSSQTSKPSLRRQGSITVPYTEAEEPPSVLFLRKYNISSDILAESKSMVTREATEIATNHKFIIKFYDKDRMTFDEEIDFNRQANILQELNHQSIECMHYFYSESDHYGVLMDHTVGGDLFERIVAKDDGYSEHDARKVVLKLLEALDLCHSKNIVKLVFTFRLSVNMKPESVLLTYKNDDTDIKLSNFSFATKDDSSLTTVCGSFDYVAPEIISNIGQATAVPYDKAVDVWSVGVLTYVILGGYLPFYGNNQESLFRSIRHGEFVFDSPYWDAVTDDAKSIISNMLVVDPKKRATVAQLLNHPWFKVEHVTKTPLTTAKDELRRVLLKRKFRAVIRIVKTAMTLSRLARSSQSREVGFHDKYKLEESIGVDGHGVIYRATTIDSGAPVQAIFYERSKLKESHIADILGEISLLRQLNHPHMIHVLDVFTNDYEGIYLVLEHIQGDDLFDRIVEKDCYSEKEARNLIKALLEAIKYSHDIGVVHSNLRPENIILPKAQDDTWIVLTNFGRSNRATRASIDYVAPEALFRVIHLEDDGKTYYEKPVDIWAIGVITYVLLCGYLPFHGINQFDLFKHIKRGKFVFDEPYWDAISSEAKSFISKCLVVDHSLRATANDLLNHAWITAYNVPSTNLPVGNELRRLNARRKLKGVFSAVKTSVAFGRLFSSKSSADSAATA
ncbi:calcium/calmodulin dependent protein kinase [Thraustotheca clavata]|uniref:Calcium/calmodulin dependent protein kinase n=1 Tax=Thraustotheca clavata TaxID=74557 RepID=A0A1W0A5C5_9STRA|nr:calcium/calmodulin dependent protein kinase [Thraustotheca clavata]